MKILFKEYFYSLMSDKKNGVIAGTLKGILFIISVIYGFFLAVLGFLYEKNILKSCKVNAKVISIGNLTLGGTGKTPFSIYLAEELLKKGKRPAIITRGYGEDEKFILQKNLDIPILIGGKKSLNAEIISKKGFADTIILDDGFQHRKLQRDIDIVLIDASNPFGNNYLFPRGILREGLDSLKRADAVIFTKIDSACAGAMQSLETIVKKENRDITIAEAVYRISSVDNIALNRQIDQGVLKDKPVILVSAIANPGYFKAIVNSLGAIILKSYEFIDHYDYKAEDIIPILKEAKEKGASLVTTEKDFVKLEKMNCRQSGADINVIKIKLELIKGKDDFFTRLYSIYNSDSF